MSQMIDAIVSALCAAGTRAVRAIPEGLMHTLQEPVTAVGLRGAQVQEKTAYTYLGMTQTETAGEVPLYGRRLLQKIFFQTVCPRSAGAKACTEEAERIMQFLLEPIAAAKITQFQMGECEYDPLADTFSCTVTAQAEGYLYALANSDDTEFTDFILKGEAK